MEPSDKNEASPEETVSNKETLPKEKEAVSAEPAEPEKNGKKRIIIILIILLLVSAALFYLFKFALAPKPGSQPGPIDVSQPVKTIEVAKDITPATTTTESAKSGQAIASSENFDLLQISLEGSGTNVYDFGENELFTLSNISSELYSAKQGDKSEIRAVVSCQTNKRSYIEVEYLKSGEKDKQVIRDEYLGFNHVLVIPALDPDSVYKYSISATDLNQTKVYSEQFVFYTGVGSISLVDILGNAVQKVFGWAIGN